jgi:ribosomal protein L32
MGLVKCKVCGKDVSETAPTCPHCGETAPGVNIKCPKCGSTNIAAGEKGFSLGKAAVGALLLGPAGLLGGMAGRKKIEIACRSCGHRWIPEPAAAQRASTLDLTTMDICLKCGSFKTKNWFCYVCKGPSKQGKEIPEPIVAQLNEIATKENKPLDAIVPAMAVCATCGGLKKQGEPCPSCKKA